MTLGQVVTNFTGQVVASCVCERVRERVRVRTSPETMHLNVYIKRKCLSFLKYFRRIKVFCRTLCFLILQRTRLKKYYYLIEFGYHFLWDIMWCDNLPRNRGRSSQVMFTYQFFISNHSGRFKRNPILLNCS